MKVKKLEDLQYVATCSVEEAANLVGISRTKAYQIARTGEIFEVVTSGKGIRVKARPLFKKLMGSVLDEVTS